jgi:hypothetical protein
MARGSWLVAGPDAPREPAGPQELFDGTAIEWGMRYGICDGGLSLARVSAAVCPMAGHRPYVRKWPFMARRYTAGAACMGLTT